MAQAHRRRGQRDPGRERFWREVLARFRASGLSVRAFCRREKLGEPLFYAWRRTIAERDRESMTVESRAAGPRRSSARQPTARRRPTRPLRRPAFLSVVMPQTPAPSPNTPAAGMALELLGGRVLRFGESLSARRVAEVVRALEALEAAT